MNNTGYGCAPWMKPYFEAHGFTMDVADSPDGVGIVVEDATPAHLIRRRAV